MNEIGTSLIRPGRCRVSNLCFVAIQKNYFGKFSAEKWTNHFWVSITYYSTYWLTCKISSTLINIKPTLCFINMINMSYCGKSHWNEVKSTLLTKFQVSQERLGGFCSEFHQWKTKPYELLFWNDFSFLLICFWNIIPNKMDAFLLGHGVEQDIRIGKHVALSWFVCPIFKWTMGITEFSFNL